VFSSNLLEILINLSFKIEICFAFDPFRLNESPFWS